jgi:hypothetical protein
MLARTRIELDRAILVEGKRELFQRNCELCTRSSAIENEAYRAPEGFEGSTFLEYSP